MAEVEDGTEVYACGSREFLEFAEQTRLDEGHSFPTEWFAPRQGPRQAGERALEAFTVHLARTGIDMEFVPGQTIVDASAEAGVAIRRT